MKKRGKQLLQKTITPLRLLLFITIIVFYLFLSCEESLPPPITVIRVESVSLEGSIRNGETLVAEVSPAEAEVTYQWYRALHKWGEYEEIPEADKQNYVVKKTDQSYYIRVVVTGYNDYIGRAVSDPLSPEEEFKVDFPPSSSSSGGGGGLGRTPDEYPVDLGIKHVKGVEIAGHPVWNTELEAQTNPINAEVTYQWYRSHEKRGDYKPVIGATERTYKLKETDENYYFRVLITGQKGTLGRAFSKEIGPVVKPNYYRIFVYKQRVDGKPGLIDDYDRDEERSNLEGIEAIPDSEVHVTYEEIKGFVPNRNHPMTVVMVEHQLILRCLCSRKQ